MVWIRTKGLFDPLLKLKYVRERTNTVSWSTNEMKDHQRHIELQIRGMYMVANSISSPGLASPVTSVTWQSPPYSSSQDTDSQRTCLPCMPAVEEWSVSVYAEESHHWLAQKLESAPEWLYLQCATDKQKKNRQNCSPGPSVCGISG